MSASDDRAGPSLSEMPLLDHDYDVERWNEMVRVEREFLAASVAVWREVDRLEAEGPYPGIPPETDLRQRERAAWEAYRAVVDRD